MSLPDTRVLNWGRGSRLHSLESASLSPPEYNVIVCEEDGTVLASPIMRGLGRNCCCTGDSDFPDGKPGKPAYNIAKAYRPIALLNTLGKLLLALMAEDLTYMSEHYALLPHSQFGGRPGRTTTDALHLLTSTIRRHGGVKVCTVSRHPSSIPQCCQASPHAEHEQKDPRGIHAPQIRRGALRTPRYHQRTAKDAHSMILYLFYIAPLLESQTARTSSPSVAGSVIDQSLRWNKHQELVHTRAVKWTSLFLRIHRAFHGLPIRSGRQLFNSVAIPRITYAADIWYTPLYTKPDSARRMGSVAITKKLQAVQRRAAIGITGAIRTTAGDTLDAHLNMLPIEETLRLTCQKAAARLASLPATHPQICETSIRTPPGTTPPYIASSTPSTQSRRPQTITPASRNPNATNPFTISIEESDVMKDRGNEAADRRPRRPSQMDHPQQQHSHHGRRTPPQNISALRQELKLAARKSAHDKWKSSARYDRTRPIDETMPSNKYLQITDELTRAEAAALIQLRTGHIGLNKHLNRINRADAPWPTLWRGEMQNSSPHICPAYNAARGR
ncbi:SubName: Full=Uncharacterized protein {ECO:0000313/EMBL:CCA77710.1}; Flags: Fragment [Serendipita indica DSM 11827]|nr:SubName: Full=Uncharacterized protein {ECO:0000313/EMBL:CCA77710.1}; Flags: Fragment [Serendipita indica DSM 11827]